MEHGVLMNVAMYFPSLAYQNLSLFIQLCNTCSRLYAHYSYYTIESCFIDRISVCLLIYSMYSCFFNICTLLQIIHHDKMADNSTQGVKKFTLAMVFSVFCQVFPSKFLNQTRQVVTFPL